MRYFIECDAAHSYKVYRVFGYLCWKRKILVSEHLSWADASTAMRTDANRSESDVGKRWVANRYGQFDV